MEVSAIIIDNGEHEIKAGFGGYTSPPFIIDTSTNSQSSNIFSPIPNGFGSNNKFKSPISRRIIKDFNEMRKIWSSIFESLLKVETKEHPLLMTESPLNGKKEKEAVTQIVMEEYNVPAYYTACPGVLSLYSQDKTSGIVVDSGASITDILPVFKCFGMTHMVETLDIGGFALEDKLNKLIMNQSMNFTDSNKDEIIRQIKEEACYVKCNSDQPIPECFNDWSGVNAKSLGNARYECPELFFKPGYELHKKIHDLIENIDQDIQSTVSEIILLSGGSTMFPYFDLRLENELKELGLSNFKVCAPPNRKDLAWIGASYMVSLSTFSQMWITKEEYEEIGPQVVHLKC